MYGKRRRPIRIWKVIFVGILSGIGFLIYDQVLNGSKPEQSTPVIITAAASAGVVQILTPAPANTVTFSAASGSNTITDASIFIPTAGIYASIIRVFLENGSWNVDNLGNNVGHLEGTAWMGPAPGNIVLSGHVELRDGSPGVFAHIDELQVGALVVLKQGEEERRYAVTEIRVVEPTDLTPIYPTTTDRLTLITCGDYDFIRNVYQERIVVVAERFG